MHIIHNSYGRKVRYDWKLEKIMKGFPVPEHESDWVWNELRKINLLAINAYKWRRINHNAFAKIIKKNHAFAIYCKKVFLDETKTQTSTKLLRKTLFESQNGKCFYCDINMNEKTGLTRDHIQPRSKGGLNLMFNIVLCCNKCNTLKSNKYVNIRSITYLECSNEKPLDKFEETNNGVYYRTVNKLHTDILTKISGNLYGI